MVLFPAFATLFINSIITTDYYGPVDTHSSTSVIYNATALVNIQSSPVIIQFPGGTVKNKNVCADPGGTFSPPPSWTSEFATLYNKPCGLTYSVSPVVTVMPGYQAQEVVYLIQTTGIEKWAQSEEAFDLGDFVERTDLIWSLDSSKSVNPDVILTSGSTAGGGN